MSLAQLEQFLRSTTARLAASYLAIIMLMSIGFSIVFYNASAHELGRQVPPPSSFGFSRYDDARGPGPRIDQFFQQRIEEGRHALLVRLILLNCLALAGGSLISYYLARRTLEPIEANMEAQVQFVGDASHELRTPLTALMAINEVALRRKNISTPEAKEVFQHNVEQVAKLQGLTNSLLRLAKLQNTDVHLQPTPLPDIVSDALNAVVSKAVDKHTTINDKIPKLSVFADKVSLTQAVATIIDNAIKYSPRNSAIEITARKQGKHAMLHIRDEGVGIASEHLPHIFDRLYQVNQARSPGTDNGYGIGLALAKKIINQHHGEIIVESTPKKGSTFTLKLPLS